MHYEHMITAYDRHVLWMQDQTGTDEAVKERDETRERLEPPRLYKVLMHNDDYTTMEFVVEMLMTVFRKNASDAISIMLAIHHEGLGECGRYPAEVAETKIEEVHGHARDAGFPLRCSMEPE